MQAAEDGPIDEPKTVADVRQTPYNLPAGYEWSTCDLSDDATVQEVSHPGLQQCERPFLDRMVMREMSDAFSFGNTS